MHPRLRVLALVTLLAAGACSGRAGSDAEDPGQAAETTEIGPFQSAAPQVVATLEVGAAPHGIRFSPSGDTAYVALSGDGQVAVIDVTRLEVVGRFPAGTTPLDLVRIGDEWLITQFRDSTLVRTPGMGATPTLAARVGAGPSLFTPTAVDGAVWLTSEFADRVTAVDLASGSVGTVLATGRRPYPADVTPDGSLAFVPGLTDGTVTVLDLLEGTPVAEVEVCPAPPGGALTTDGVSYLVACGGSNELAFLNTASFRVTDRISGLGPRPFSVSVSPDGAWALVNNAGGSTVSVVSVPDRQLAATLEVGEQPIVIRMHPDGQRAFVSNEVSGTMSVIQLPELEPLPSREPRNEVYVLGMIHGEHRTSERYSTAVLEDILRTLAPDVVLTEIPPNRFEAARTEFAERGTLTEPRVTRFPEYVDVLFPLQRELGFEIVPTAGWNQQMSDYRERRLREISQDPDWASRWADYQEASRRSDAALQRGGAADDPVWINSDAYDAAQDIRLQVYNDLFNDDIGPGGWDRINRAHYANISAALDRLRGQGLRVVITYGAGHKGWFLRQLRQRTDIRVLDPVPAIEKALALR